MNPSTPSHSHPQFNRSTIVFLVAITAAYAVILVGLVQILRNTDQILAGMVVGIGAALLPLLTLCAVLSTMPRKPKPAPPAAPRQRGYRIKEFGGDVALVLEGQVGRKLGLIETTDRTAQWVTYHDMVSLLEEGEELYLAIQQEISSPWMLLYGPTHEFGHWAPRYTRGLCWAIHFYALPLEAHTLPPIGPHPLPRPNEPRYG